MLPTGTDPHAGRVHRYEANVTANVVLAPTSLQC
jgi:hypothetical protein